MRTLKESLLGDMEKNVSATEKDVYKDLYPIPKTSDFRKTSLGYYTIKWNCEMLIKQYLDILNIDKSISDHIVGFYISFEGGSRSNNCHLTNISFLLDDGGDTYAIAELHGISYNNCSTPEVKKDILNFFKEVLKNPEIIKALFEYSNKRENELNKYGFCDELSLKEILKY